MRGSSFGNSLNLVLQSLLSFGKFNGNVEPDSSIFHFLLESRVCMFSTTALFHIGKQFF